MAADTISAETIGRAGNRVLERNPGRDGVWATIKTEAIATVTIRGTSEVVLEGDQAKTISAQTIRRARLVVLEQRQIACAITTQVANSTIIRAGFTVLEIIACTVPAQHTDTAISRANITVFCRVANPVTAYNTFPTVAGTASAVFPQSACSVTAHTGSHGLSRTVSQTGTLDAKTTLTAPTLRRLSLGDATIITFATGFLWIANSIFVAGITGAIHRTGIVGLTPFATIIATLVRLQSIMKGLSCLLWFQRTGIGQSGQQDQRGKQDASSSRRQHRYSLLVMKTRNALFIWDKGRKSHPQHRPRIDTNRMH